MLTKGNSRHQTRVRAQQRKVLAEKVARVRSVAERDKEARFTTLWHHVYDENRLHAAYLALSPRAAAGVDEETWQTYGENLEANLQDLAGRLKRGAYRAKPVLRVFIPKSDGRLRPIGIPTLEDKIVQRATTEVLNGVYEADFLGISYGFRPGRSQHNALDGVTVGIERKKVNWVLDADIRGFFDAIDHEWTAKFVEHRIADKRVLRHIKKWLRAGVLEGGNWKETAKGTPQGGSISPLLSNIYLHYVLDLWVQQWRKRCRGDVIVVRYADDFVVGFQYKSEAVRFRQELEARLQKFSLELHPEKTRLLEFGRFANEDREGRGEGRPKTFEFLGFTHYCGKKKNGKFKVGRKTSAKRRSAKLVALRIEARKRMHQPIPLIGRWLQAVLVGAYRYYAVPGNLHSLRSFRHAVARILWRALRRRSQRTAMTLDRFKRLATKWLPFPRILHPYPDQRLRLTRGRSPVR